MKSIVVLSVVLFATLLVVNAEEEMKEEYCKNGSKPSGCSIVLCNKAGTKMIGKACPEIRCPGKTVEDIKKPYPQCCPKCA